MCQKRNPKTCIGCVSVYNSITGWTAVKLVPDPEMDFMCTPWDTGVTKNETRGVPLRRHDPGLRPRG